MDKVYDKAVKTVALIGKPRSVEIAEPLVALCDCLRERGIRVLL